MDGLTGGDAAGQALSVGDVAHTVVGASCCAPDDVRTLVVLGAYAVAEAVGIDIDQVDPLGIADLLALDTCVPAAVAGTPVPVTVGLAAIRFSTYVRAGVVGGGQRGARSLTPKNVWAGRSVAPGLALLTGVEDAVAAAGQTRTQVELARRGVAGSGPSGVDVSARILERGRVLRVAGFLRGGVDVPIAARDVSVEL